MATSSDAVAALIEMGFPPEKWYCAPTDSMLQLPCFFDLCSEEAVKATGAGGVQMAMDWYIVTCACSACTPASVTPAQMHAPLQPTVTPAYTLAQS